MIVNRLQLADVRGCALGTVDKDVQNGMPYLERPDRDTGAKEWRFDTGVVIKWLVERDRESSPEAEGKNMIRREQAAKTGLRELELAREQAILVRIDDVADALEGKLSIVKSRLLAIPGRLAQALAVESDPVKVQNLLKKEVSEALEAISEGREDEDEGDSDK